MSDEAMPLEDNVCGCGTRGEALDAALAMIKSFTKGDNDERCFRYHHLVLLYAARIMDLGTIRMSDGVEEAAQSLANLVTLRKEAEAMVSAHERDILQRLNDVLASDNETDELDASIPEGAVRH